MKPAFLMRNSLIVTLLACLPLALFAAEQYPVPELKRISGSEPRNIIFILVDDQRYDAISALGHPFLQTPGADSLIENGVHFKNAYVTTSLCSPSRASMLTGLYAHSHRIVDNSTPVADDLVFFSQYLQKAGYETAFIGKWHMGYNTTEPRRGWDHWISFLGQGDYFPINDEGVQSMLNVNGQAVPQTKYITDELTDYAVEWLESKRRSRDPWMLYLSHKAVHYEFYPAPRHKGLYDDVVIPPFPTTQGTELDELKPMWARNQRNSWHGAEYPFHNGLGKADDIYRRYCEAMLAVDESTVRVIDTLKELGLYESTLIIYMGDNGHMWGEQSLIDKRTAYEASVRVPLMMQCPEILPRGLTVDGISANIDIAPTILEAAGLQPPDHMHGRSLMPLAEGNTPDDWRQELLYEYFWERWAPSTPTIHALITPEWKFVRAYGMWDVHELYNTKQDPNELVNLYLHPDHHARALAMDERLFELLAETDGQNIPLFRGWGGSGKEYRSPEASEWAPFPEALKVLENPHP